jgi:ABC-type multidrug transport system fused ATPase/permease subunit
MVEPLFMRFIIDDVLLVDALDAASRLSLLHWAGAAFVGVVVLSNLIGAVKDYRQRLLNIHVMLSLRRSLFNRLLHLPLPKLWDMKTGGILSRLTGDIDSTTGFLQMAIMSPAISVIRLVIAVGILLALNWRLALMAMAIIPGAMIMSFVFAARIRPIYRTIRKDVELIDGRVGETFSGIRVVRAFGREALELFDYMVGRHTVLRKEMFAQRRELVLWTSWSLLLGAVNVVIVWYGGYLNVAGGATVGDIMAFQWYTFLLLNPVWNIVNSFSELQRSLAAMERVFEVEVTEAQYYAVIDRKSAALLSAACEAGAILGGVTRAERRQVAEFGRELGLAFQIRDDALDYEAGADVLGKLPYTDLREGKVTLPLLLALKRCTSAERAAVAAGLKSAARHDLAEAAGDPLDLEELAPALEIVARYRGVEDAVRRAEEHVGRARTAVAPFPDGAAKEALTAAADFAVSRDR